MKVWSLKHHHVSWDMINLFLRHTLCLKQCKIVPAKTQKFAYYYFTRILLSLESCLSHNFLVFFFFSTGWFGVRFSDHEGLRNKRGWWQSKWRAVLSDIGHTRRCGLRAGYRCAGHDAHFWRPDYSTGALLVHHSGNRRYHCDHPTSSSSVHFRGHSSVHNDHAFTFVAVGRHPAVHVQILQRQPFKSVV